MINIFSLYEDFRGRVNAHQGGHIRPLDFVSWVHEIQMDIFNDRVKDFQKTQKIADEITPFLESVNVLISNVSGSSWDLVTKPKGYENYASSRIVKKGGVSCGCKDVKEFNANGEEEKGVCKAYVDEDELAELKMASDAQNCEVSISLVDNDRWGSICSHPRKKPTCSSPKMTQYGSGFKIAPKGCATSIIMDFFRKPIKPIFNYTVINPQQENEYYQFVQLGSVDLEWSEQLLPLFMAKLMDKYATFVGDANLWQQSKVEQKSK